MSATIHRLRDHPGYRPTLRQVNCAALQAERAYVIFPWTHLLGKRVQHVTSGMRGRCVSLRADDDVVLAEVRTTWGKEHWLPAARLLVLDAPGPEDAA